MRNKFTAIVAFVLFNSALIGCRPRTPAEKAKDSIEDAAHDAGQAIERAGEKVKDAAN